jgi:transposase-like protein
MNDLNKRLQAARDARLVSLRELDKTTIEMRLLAAEARAAGLGVLKIARLLGVTHRTVYLWLRNK